MIDTGRYRVDAALLLKIRESFADCPGVITLSMDRFTVGLRATGESTQILAGVRF